MILGSGDYRYERVEGWAGLPDYFTLIDPVDVATDSGDRVFVFCRGNHPVLIFDREGNFISCWGEGSFRWPHGIFIGPDDSVYLIDGQAHVVEKYTPGGELLMTLGIRDWAEPTHHHAPFNIPTGLALGPAGEMYVSDGYGNSLVHKFSPEGQLIKTWGGHGTGPGQFITAHNLAVDRYGTVYVCDRHNDRIQTFTPEGEYLTSWTGFHWPMDIYIDPRTDIAYVVEAELSGPNQPRISIRDLNGQVLSAWEGREREGKGLLDIGHGIWVDSHGDIYETEIDFTHRIQKFARVS
jgi:DNA-binding beta-propeller fold protein YncE